MSGPPPATAAVRRAVRLAVADLPPGAVVAAAVSGGADSLALAAALAFERPGSWAFVVDHQLQPDSAKVAARAAEQCRHLGLTAEVLSPADPGTPTDRTPAGAGPEARARELRYRLLDAAAGQVGATVLLGHTLDDQAETVLLGLARGAGARSLAGMPARRGRYRRPLLQLRRSVTAQACADAGLEPWDDPHNSDSSYARVRARQALPLLDQALGPGLAVALARTADQLREDADALDALVQPTGDVAQLAGMPAAVRARSLKRWAEAGCGQAVTGAHVQALRSLVQDWHGQGPVGLPGGSSVAREGGRLVHRPRD